MKEVTYFVKGMHCASCELLIEKKLLGERGICVVDASAGSGKVRIEYENQKPTIERLNKIFAKDGYVFSEHKSKDKVSPTISLTTIGIVILFIIGFIAIGKSSFSALLSVNAKSSLPAFFVFGVLAGLSSCAALVGGIILSMSKKWAGALLPHFLFNSGRLISFAVFGALLGAFGNFLQISPTITSTLTICVAIIMIILGLQMLGVEKLRGLQITMPKSITRFAANESNFKGRYLPFLMGVLTFFLPCGFTLTAQGLALTSGSALQSGLIMFSFALGTLPSLLLIGFSSIKFSQRPHLSGQFLKIAGALVLFFAFYNINAQLNLLGLKSLSDLNLSANQIIDASQDGFAPLINGKQVLQMEAMSYAYQPNYFKIRVGIPVRWEIADKGVSGCTNAIVSKGLFIGEVNLASGKTTIKEFTPQKPGKYKFSCWMGMVSGTIEVVGQDGLTGDTVPVDKEIPSGATGCGASGGGGCTGGCGGGCGNPAVPMLGKLLGLT